MQIVDPYFTQCRAKYVASCEMSLPFCERKFLADGSGDPPTPYSRLQ